MLDRASTASILGVLAMSVACPPASGEPTAGQTTVIIERFAFTPAVIEVKAGAEIVFLNKDQAPHAVVGEDKNGEVFRSQEQIDEDEAYSLKLFIPGEFEIHCGLHSAMKGKITVTK